MVTRVGIFVGESLGNKEGEEGLLLGILLESVGLAVGWRLITAFSIVD